jgi:aquaporin Z
MKSTVTDQSQSSANRRMLNPQVTPDFLDSTLEWRRMYAEVWGTFLLVLVAAGGGVVRDLSGGSLSLAMIVVAPGLMVMGIIYFMGTVSGAHLNPAVTLAFAVRGNSPWRLGPGYILARSPAVRRTPRERERTPHGGEPPASVLSEGSTAVGAAIDKRSFVMFPLNR